MSLTKKKDLLHFFPLTIWPSETFHLPCESSRQRDREASRSSAVRSPGVIHYAARSITMHTRTLFVYFPFPPSILTGLSCRFCATKLAMNGARVMSWEQREERKYTRQRPVSVWRKNFFFLSGGGTKESERGKKQAADSARDSAVISTFSRHISAKRMTPTDPLKIQKQRKRMKWTRQLQLL